MNVIRMMGKSPSFRPAKRAQWGYERHDGHAVPMNSKRRASDDSP